MWKCPVCEIENDGCLCRECGFDISMNYEKYPTLCAVSGRAISAKRVLFTENEDKKRRMSDHSLELVLCIDGTQSMEDADEKGETLLHRLKNEADTIHKRLQQSMARRAMVLTEFRVRIVLFRDYFADGDEAMKVTDFFRIPEQEDNFVCCIRAIQADGGGDLPENALEGLAYSIRSRWERKPRSRQVIVVLTDADCHRLGFSASSPYYPKGMAANMEELYEWWEEMPLAGKRLMLFAPLTSRWREIIDCWENVVYFPVEEGNGLREVSVETILNLIAQIM